MPFSYIYSIKNKYMHLYEDYSKDRIVLPHAVILYSDSNMRLAPIPGEALRPGIEHWRACNWFDASFIHLARTRQPQEIQRE